MPALWISWFSSLCISLWLRSQSLSLPSLALSPMVGPVLTWSPTSPLGLTIIWLSCSWLPVLQLWLLLLYSLLVVPSPYSPRSSPLSSPYPIYLSFCLSLPIAEVNDSCHWLSVICLRCCLTFVCISVCLCLCLLFVFVTIYLSSLSICPCLLSVFTCHLCLHRTNSAPLCLSLSISCLTGLKSCSSVYPSRFVSQDYFSPFTHQRVRGQLYRSLSFSVLVFVLESEAYWPIPDYGLFGQLFTPGLVCCDWSLGWERDTEIHAM